MTHVMAYTPSPSAFRRRDALLVGCQAFGMVVVHRPYQSFSHIHSRGQDKYILYAASTSETVLSFRPLHSRVMVSVSLSRNRLASLPAITTATPSETDNTCDLHGRIEARVCT